jgi:hypothetical protein
VDGDLQVTKGTEIDYSEWAARGYGESQNQPNTALNDAFDTLATRCAHMLNQTKYSEFS